MLDCQHQMFIQDSCNVASMFATNNVTMSITQQRRLFGQFIKESREEKGFSQEGAANKAEMDRQQWYRIENGRSGTKRETVIKMANAVDADVDKALTLAGFAPESSRVLPEELQIMDYDGFDAGDLKDIAEYISFKRMQKEKQEKEGK